MNAGAIKPLAWREYKALGNRIKTVAHDCFHNEFRRFDKRLSEIPQADIDKAQADYERCIRNALAEPAGEAGPVAWQWKRYPQDDLWYAVPDGASVKFARLGYTMRPLYTTPPDASATREVEPGEKLAAAIRQFEQDCKNAGGYMPVIASLLRIYADEMADKYPDDTNNGISPALAGAKP